LFDLSVWFQNCVEGPWNSFRHLQAFTYKWLFELYSFLVIKICTTYHVIATYFSMVNVKEAIRVAMYCGLWVVYLSIFMSRRWRIGPIFIYLVKYPDAIFFIIPYTLSLVLGNSYRSCKSEAFISMIRRDRKGCTTANFENLSMRVRKYLPAVE